MRSSLRILLLAGCFFSVLYSASCGLYEAFPYVGEGSRIVYERKLEYLKDHSIFPSDVERKIAVFGNSKILSAFIPDLFDKLSGGRAYSYNLGLPDADRFIPVLEELIATENIPTDIIITSAWQDPPKKNPLVLIDNDQELIMRLVPFRNLARDTAIFINRSRYRGGVEALYKETKRLSDKVLEDRGYHFIAGQSSYSDARLPEDFALNSDQPDVYLVRDFSFDGSAFERLSRILEEHAIRAFIAPTYYRVHQYKPDPQPNARLLDGVVDNPHVRVLGRDYLSLPNRLFSDPLHVNPEGARLYTTTLWELIRPHIEDDVSS